MKKNNKQGKGKKMISVHDIMKRHNLSYQTVNHYTNFGLLSVSIREGKLRLYDKGVVEKRLRKVKELVKEGYSLGLIRKRLIGI